MTKCKSLSRRALHSAPRSRKGDRAAQQRGGRGDSLNASSSAARPLHHASHGPPPPHCVRGRIKQNPSRDAVGRPSFAHHHHAEKAWLPVTERGKRSAERRMQAMSALTRGCATVTPPSPACGGGLGGGRARLSALTLAALATGYHPDGSAPEPGFHDAAAARCFAGKPQRCVALSTLRADRSFCRSTGDPEPPGSGWQIRRAGTAARSASTACLSGKAPSVSEMMRM
jgi:hypothetical protein